MALRGRDWLALGVCLAACFAAAGLGSMFTASAIPTWYAQIRKPAASPPNWVFGPVWTALYTMMAVAVWRVWRKAGNADVRLPLALFAIQLALNAAWSPVFFGLRSFGGAFAIIVVLWCAIAATMVAFFRVSRPAGWLLVPYLAWVSFASYLNLAIWRLNG